MPLWFSILSLCVQAQHDLSISVLQKLSVFLPLLFLCDRPESFALSWNGTYSGNGWHEVSSQFLSLVSLKFWSTCSESDNCFVLFCSLYFIRATTSFSAAYITLNIQTYFKMRDLRILSFREFNYRRNFGHMPQKYPNFHRCVFVFVAWGFIFCLFCSIEVHCLGCEFLSIIRIVYFFKGWKRELVLRGVYDPMNQSGSKSKRKLPPSDVYYFTPDGKKLVCVTGSVIICFMMFYPY